MTENVSSNEMSIKELIALILDWYRYLIAKWKIGLLVGVLFSAVAFYRVYSKKPIYTAEVTLAFDEKSGSGGVAGIASQIGLELGGASAGAFTGDNNLELLKSRRMIEKTLTTVVVIEGKSQMLINRYIDFYRGPKETYVPEENELPMPEFTPDMPREAYGRSRDSVLFQIYKSLKSNITVAKLDKKLSIISLQLTFSDEVFAKYFSEELVKNTAKFYVETKTRKYRNNVLILEDRLDSVRRELNNEMMGAATAKDGNMNVIRAQGSVKSARNQINISVLSSMYGELAKNLEFAKYALLKEEPNLLIIDSPTYPLEKQSPSKIKNAIGGFIFGIVIVLIYFIFLRLKRQFID